MKSEIKSSRAIVLIAIGIASAFALAACCALPILLTRAGLSPFWLAPIATVGSQFNTAFTLLAVVSLAGSAFIILHSAKTCAPGDPCTRPWFRVSIVATAIVGIALLIASKPYA